VKKESHQLWAVFCFEVFLGLVVYTTFGLGGMWMVINLLAVCILLLTTVGVVSVGPI
jgi:hypothetical protein